MGDSSEIGSLTLSTFSLLTFLSLFLYLLMLIHVQRKLRILQAYSSDLTTTKMFVMSVWTACLVRVMSFAGLGALGIANVEVHYDVGGEIGLDEVGWDEVGWDEVGWVMVIVCEGDCV